jgi:hypothetical protein
MWPLGWQGCWRIATWGNYPQEGTRDALPASNTYPVRRMPRNYFLPSFSTRETTPGHTDYGGNIGHTLSSCPATAPVLWHKSKFPALLANASRLQLPGTAFANKPGTVKFYLKKNRVNLPGAKSLSIDPTSIRSAVVMQCTVPAGTTQSPVRDPRARRGALKLRTKAPASRAGA